MTFMKTIHLFFVPATISLLLLLGCEENTTTEEAPDPTDTGDTENSATEYTAMSGATANCEFDTITFRIGAGDPVEVHINSLPVEALNGAEKVGDAQWDIVTRRGVSFDEILEKAGIEADAETPVNCVARDGFDPLRTKLQGDTSALPTLSFFHDFAYVYVGNPGDKDPLYPEMEGRSLIVDWDVSADDEVPSYLGGTVASLGMFRWKMIEKIDGETFGMIEISPVVE